VGNPNQIAGVIQGAGTAENGTFSSANAKDFGIGSGVLDATLAATFGAKQSFNGSITYSAGGVFSFTHTYNSAYDTAPPLSPVAGTWGAMHAFTGSSSYWAGGGFSFTHTYVGAYDTAPPLSGLAGVYQGRAGRSGGSETATVTVSSDGTYSGSQQDGCTFTGR